MENTAFVTLQIKDLFSPKATKIAASIDKMVKSMRALDKKCAESDNKYNQLSAKFDKIKKKTESLENSFNKVNNLKAINLDKLVKGDLKKELSDVDKLNAKITKLKNNIEQRRDPKSGIHATDNLRKQLRDLRAEERRQLNPQITQPTTQNRTGVAGAVTGLISVASGGAFLRSAITNAKDFDTALYDINRQLGDNENLQDYVKFIEKYTLATGQSRIDTANQVAELRKTLKEGEGLQDIADKMDIMRFATNQLEVETNIAAQAVEILGDAYKMTGNEQKAFFAQANKMEDVYGSLVSGGDIIDILSRNIPLLSNAKIMPKQDALTLATFAKANTSLPSISVGTALGRVIRGGDKAFGGGYAMRAEKSGKTIKDIILEDAQAYAKLKTQYEKNEFALSRLDRENAEDIQILDSILKEGSSINQERLNSFAKTQKAYEEGKITIIEYKNELSKLTKAEKTIVASMMATEEALKEFNRTLTLLADTYEAQLGRISESWKLITGAFGESALRPVLTALASGLEIITPFITNLIKQSPLLATALGVVASGLTLFSGAFLGLKLFGPTAFGGFFALLSTLGGTLLKFGGIVSLVLADLMLLKDLFTNSDTMGIKAGTEKLYNRLHKNDTPEQAMESASRLEYGALMFGSGISGRTTDNKFNPNSPKIQEWNERKRMMPLPSIATSPQMQPNGEITVNVKVEGQAQATATLEKQNNLNLVLAKPTTTKTL